MQARRSVFMISSISSTDSLHPPLIQFSQICVAASKLMTFNYNPTITMPWVTPAPITGLLVGGIPLFLLILFCVAVTTLIWYPFFKMADNQALKEEAAAAD